MSAPLFSEEENRAFEDSKVQLRIKYSNERGIRMEEWDSYTREQQNLYRAEDIETAKRAQARADEFLNALIVLVGSRGAIYVDFDSAFTKSDSNEMALALEKFDTPKTRRDLYTLLRALSETPRSWGRSAFTRFLRGIGKQKGAKYHGAGMFGVDYEWTGAQVEAVCEVIAGEHQPYAKVFLSHTDVQQVIHDLDPNFRVTPYEANFCGTRVDKDTEFLNKLCDMLEARGLADISKPKTKKPKKERVPKVFKPGDVIRKRDLRDLPLPAHVRIQVERFEPGKYSTTRELVMIEHVVTYLGDRGNYQHLIVGNQGDIAFKPWWQWERKDFLDGAIFLGIWQGKFSEKEVRSKYVFRKPEAK